MFSTAYSAFFLKMRVVPPVPLAGNNSKNRDMMRRDGREIPPRSRRRSWPLATNDDHDDESTPSRPKTGAMTHRSTLRLMHCI